MRIVIIGGTGLIGSRVVTMLHEGGHDAVPATPHTGVDAFTGEGLRQAVTNADVVIDVSNAPASADGEMALKFFETSTRNILVAEAAAGVRHHILLSIVGVDRQSSGYHLGKVAQERLTRESTIPYTIIRATQFFEFLTGIADTATVGSGVRLAPVLFQPVAADDVARALCDAASSAPVNGIVELAGPEPYRLDELVRRALRARKDARDVVTDSRAPYFGTVLDERSLMPGADARLGRVTFQSWEQQHPLTGSRATEQQASAR